MSLGGSRGEINRNVLDRDSLSLRVVHTARARAREIAAPPCGSSHPLPQTGKTASVYLIYSHRRGRAAILAILGLTSFQLDPLPSSIQRTTGRNLAGYMCCGGFVPPRARENYTPIHGEPTRTHNHFSLVKRSISI